MTDEAFSRAARTYGDTLFRVAYHALQNRADAEDVMQTVLLRLYESRKEFESEAHLKHWLLRVAVNESRKVLRSFWRRRAVSLDEQRDEAAPEDSAQREVFEAVMALEPKYRLTPTRPPFRPGCCGPGPACARSWPRERKRRNLTMFDPRLYRNACSELRPSEEKIEEMIAMTANHGCKKKIRHPLRMGAVIAATMALLTIGASAAANPEMVESF